MLILKQNAANSVPTPPAGKGTIFLDDSDTLSVKTSDGNVENFPTVAASNSQVVFMNGTSLSGDAELTYNYNTNVLTVSGNVAAGNVLTNNLLYANGTAWDLSDPGGSNTEIQFNDDESFGGSAAFTFNKSTNTVSIGNALSVTGNASAGNLSTGGNLSVTSNISAGNINAGNLLTANFVTGTLTTSSQPNITSVGTLTDLNVSGNTVIGGNLTVNGNVVYVNVETLDVEDPVIVLGGGPNGAAPVSDDGKDRGTQLQYFSGSAKNAFMGWDNSNSEFGMGSVVTVTNDVVTFTTYGNLRVGNIIGNGQALTGMNGANVTGTVANANYALYSGTVLTNAQPNITSVGTLSSLGVTGNTTSNNFNATTYITAASIYANSGTVGAQYVNASVDVTANRDVLAGNVFANSGTIGGATGNFSGNVSAGGIKTNNLYYANGTPWDLQLPGGSNTQIQFNDADQFGGSAAFTFDKSSNLVSVSANLNANNLNATTHVTAGNVYANSGTVGASLLTGTLTTASQPNVTSVGTLSSLAVTGSATAGNVYANTGTIGAANLTGTLTTASQPNVTSLGTLGSLAVTGNVTAGNVYSNTGTIGASLLTGTLTTASQPNITSVGTLSSLTVTGNAGANNFNATTHVTAGNVYANTGTIGASLLTGTLTTASQPNVTSVGTLSGLGVNGNITAVNITANTGVFTGNAAGLTNIPGGNIVGNISGNISNAAHAVTANTVVDAAQPNITSVGTLSSLAVTGNTSSGNFNTAGKVVASTFESNVATGTAPMVVASTTKVANLNADLLDGFSTATAATANTVVIRDADGSFSANVVTATLSGAATTAGTVTTAAQPNITSVGTLSSLGVSGNITAANITANTGVFTGNGSGLTALAGGNVTGQVANALVAGTVYTAAQPNITSVGTLTGLGVNGNITAANITANTGVFTGNGSGLSQLAGGNVTGQVANALVAGTVYTAAQPNITSVGTLTSLAVTGNTTSGNFVGALANGNTNLNIPAANGNLNVSVAGNANILVVTGTGVDVAGTLNASSNANVGNLGTAQVLASANVTAPQLISNVATGTAPLAVSSTTRVANLNVAYANVADNINVVDVSTGTYYPVLANAATGNVSEGSNANLTFNAATGALNATLLGGTLTTAAQPNITSVGTLSSLSVTGNAGANNFNATTHVTAGNVWANTGTVGATNLTGTLTTAAQPNITSVGTLTSVTVTGNVAAGNLTTTGVLSVTGTGVSSIAGNLDMTSNTIINLAEPTNAQDAATKNYVDTYAQGLNVHDSCYAATANTLTILTGGGTITYNNGSSGVGANLTLSGSPTKGFLTANTFDGNTTAVANSRILVKNEANAVLNGIYVVTSNTVLTRATDYDSVPEVEAGDFIFVQDGDTYNDTGWVQTSVVTAIGTAGNNIVFTQFSGQGTYTAGTGLTLTGTQFSISNTAVTAASYGNGDRVASFTVNSQGQLTAASNTVIAANAANLTGTTLATSIVTSSLTAVGTVTTGVWNNNIGSSATFAAGLSGANLASITGANVTGTVGSATTAGTVTTAAQPNITSVGTLTSLGVTGNITGGNLLGPHANGNSNVNIPAAAGNVNISVNGTANVLVVTGTGVNVAGTLNTGSGVITGNGSGLTALAGGNVTGQVGNALVSGTVYTAAQPNITSVGTLTSLGVTGTTTSGNFATAGNITASFLVSNVATGTAPLTVTSTTRVANLNVAYANVADFTNVTTQSSGNAYLVFANALTGNVAETANATFVANTSNGALYATTFIGAVSGNGAALTDLNASNISSGTLAQARLANSSLTVNGTSISLGGSATITANTTQTLTLGSFLTGTSFNGGTAVTAAVDATSANTASKVVSRDASGNFSAGTITATLSGAATTAGTVTTAAQPNITSVGTLTSLTVAGNISQTSGYEILTTNGAVTAAGTVQGNATAIASQVNVISTVPSGSGVIFPTATAGLRITLINTAANACAVYPASTAQINSLGANVAFSLLAGARLDFQATSATQWYTLNATYQ